MTISSILVVEIVTTELGEVHVLILLIISGRVSWPRSLTIAVVWICWFILKIRISDNLKVVKGCLTNYEIYP